MRLLAWSSSCLLLLDHLQKRLMGNRLRFGYQSRRNGSRQTGTYQSKTECDIATYIFISMLSHQHQTWDIRVTYIPWQCLAVCGAVCGPVPVEIIPNFKHHSVQGILTIVSYPSPCNFRTDTGTAALKMHSACQGC